MNDEELHISKRARTEFVNDAPRQQLELPIWTVILEKPYDFAATYDSDTLFDFPVPLGFMPTTYSYYNMGVCQVSYYLDEYMQQSEI